VLKVSICPICDATILTMPTSSSLKTVVPTLHMQLTIHLHNSLKMILVSKSKTYCFLGFLPRNSISDKQNATNFALVLAILHRQAHQRRNLTFQMFALEIDTYVSKVLQLRIHFTEHFSNGNDSADDHSSKKHNPRQIHTHR